MMFRRNQKFNEWTDAPQMDTGAPEPAVIASDDILTLAYRTQNREFAVIRFHGVYQHIFGYPNDEALGGHPLYSSSLNFYAFNRVVDSSYLKELDRRNAVCFPNSSARFIEETHWFISFHDETLEIVGGKPEILGTVPVSSAIEALGHYAV